MREVEKLASESSGGYRKRGQTSDRILSTSTCTPIRTLTFFKYAVLRTRIRPDWTYLSYFAGSGSDYWFVQEIGIKWHNNLFSILVKISRLYKFIYKVILSYLRFLRKKFWYLAISCHCASFLSLGRIRIRVSKIFGARSEWFHSNPHTEIMWRR